MISSTETKPSERAQEIIDTIWANTGYRPHTTTTDNKYKNYHYYTSHIVFSETLVGPNKGAIKFKAFSDTNDLNKFIDELKLLNGIPLPTVQEKETLDDNLYAFSALRAALTRTWDRIEQPRSKNQDIIYSFLQHHKDICTSLGDTEPTEINVQILDVSGNFVQETLINYQNITGDKVITVSTEVEDSGITDKDSLITAMMNEISYHRVALKSLERIVNIATTQNVKIVIEGEDEDTDDEEDCE